MKKQEMVLEALKERPEGSGEEIARYVWEKYQVQIPQGTIRQVKSRSKAILTEPDSNIDSDRLIDSGADHSGDEISESNPSPSDRDGVSDSISGSERGDNLSSLEAGEIQKLENISTEDLKFNLKEKELPKEAAAISRQYENRARQALEEKGKPQRDAELKELEIEEQIDAELVSDNFIGIADLAAQRAGEPLSEKEKQKGRKVIGRVFKRRLAFLYSYGDIVNLVLWIGQVLPKRIFRIRPRSEIPASPAVYDLSPSEGENPQ